MMRELINFSFIRNCGGYLVTTRIRDTRLTSCEEGPGSTASYHTHVILLLSLTVGCVSPAGLDIFGSTATDKQPPANHSIWGSFTLEHR